MPTRLEEPEDHNAMAEILRRALEIESGTGAVPLDKLMVAAEELGISKESIRQAELEYRQGSGRRGLLAAYRNEQRRAFQIHLGVYAVVNVFICLMNLLTWRDTPEFWAIWVILGWGIGLGCHAVVTSVKHDWDSEEFQEWLQKRREKEAELPGHTPE